jgi:membrane-associated phospholipid phosphatase
VAAERALAGRRRFQRWYIQGPVCFGFYEGFEWVRSKVQGARHDAVVNALQVIHAERVLHLFHEARVEHWVLPCAPVCNVAAVPEVQRDAIRFWNVYYGFMHFAVPGLVLVFLFWKFPERYRLWRNTAGAMLALSLLGFWLYPVLPPRLLPLHYGFFDAARFGGVGPIGKAEAGPLANAYAAMPSLHIGWSSWCAFALAPVLRRRWAKALIVAYPFCTMFAVVVTANHYILDGIGGLGTLALAYLVARLVTRPRATAGTVGARLDDASPVDRTTTARAAP